MLDRTDHEQSEEQCSFSLHQNLLIGRAIDNDETKD